MKGARKIIGKTKDGKVIGVKCRRSHEHKKECRPGRNGVTEKGIQQSKLGYQSHRVYKSS